MKGAVCQWSCRKNAQLAADDAAAAQTAAPSSDKVLSGEQGFSEDMAQLRQKAREQGTDQPAPRDAAEEVKKKVHRCALQSIHTPNA